MGTERTSSPDLLNLSRALTEEQQRHVREHLSEAELTVFDLLTRPGPQGQFKEVIAELLNHGADINAHGPDGSTVFLKALAGLYGQDAVPLFLAYHPDFKVTDVQGNGPLAICIQREDLKSVSMLIDAGAPVDVPNQDGVTPLMMVAQGNQYRSYRIPEYVDLAKYAVNRNTVPAIGDCITRRLPVFRPVATRWLFQAEFFAVLLNGFVGNSKFLGDL